MDEKIKVTVLFTAVLLCFSSCVRNNKIVRFLENESLFLESDTIVINFTDIIGVEWDRMHVVYEWRATWDISDELGFEYKGRAGGFNITTFIFVKDNQVVYEERQRDSRRILNAPFERRIFDNTFYLIIRRKRDNGTSFYFYPLAGAGPMSLS